MPAIASEVERFRSRIGWGRALVASWSFYWRFFLVAYPAMVVCSIPFIIAVIVFRLDRLWERNPVWMVVGLVFAAPIFMAYVWPMRRTLERNVPGLVWRVAWKDAALASWSFLWRVSAFVILFHLLVGPLQTLLANCIPPLAQFVDPAEPTSALMDLFVLIWAMRAALRIQFRRSLRQRRIQGATGILGEPDGAG